MSKHFVGWSYQNKNEYESIRSISIRGSKSIAHRILSQFKEIDADGKQIVQCPKFNRGNTVWVFFLSDTILSFCFS